jgi:hypothetical protein
MKQKVKQNRLLPRRQWAINPVTRVKESDKKYSRNQAGKNIRKELDES